jgi:hypothetical protein
MQQDKPGTPRSFGVKADGGLYSGSMQSESHRVVLILDPVKVAGEYETSAIPTPLPAGGKAKKIVKITLKSNTYHPDASRVPDILDAFDLAGMSDYIDWKKLKIYVGNEGDNQLLVDFSQPDPTDVAPPAASPPTPPPSSGGEPPPQTQTPNEGPGTHSASGPQGQN